METSPKVAPRTYEDFEPSFQWKEDEGSKTLVIYTAGFKKNQLRVQMDNYGRLRISGERPLAGDHWIRFRKDFSIPQNTRSSDIRAKFENENLYLILPKLIAESQPQKQPTKAPELKPPKETSTEKGPIEQKDGAQPSSKSDSAVPKQSNGKNGVTDGAPSSSKSDANGNSKVTSMIEAPSMREKQEDDQIHKPENQNKPASYAGKNDDELSDSRKRKGAAEELRDSGSTMEFQVGGLRMRFKKPRQLMLSVGAAAVILAGIAIYVSYKLRNSMNADDN